MIEFWHPYIVNSVLDIQSSSEERTSGGHLYSTAAEQRTRNKIASLSAGHHGKRSTMDGQMVDNWWQSFNVKLEDKGVGAIFESISWMVYNVLEAIPTIR